jgi:magnesium transporter
MADNFLKDTSLITYSPDKFNQTKYSSISEISLTDSIIGSGPILWLNIYGFNYPDQIKNIIRANGLDEFLCNLIFEENHNNKVIELEKCFFISLKAPQKNEPPTETPNQALTGSSDNKITDCQFEQLFFIVSSNFIWTIQEKPGDHFNHIRTRLKENKGIVRRRNTDYLLYLLTEAILEGYSSAYEKLTLTYEKLKKISSINPAPDFIIEIETFKNQLFLLKKAIAGIRESASNITALDIKGFNPLYFSEIKEKASYLIDEIDFDLQQLESRINLIFSMQSHRLNEVMKTLTIISVIFIPLTFMAGIYGMNFENMPELKAHYGYFILLGIMLVTALGSVFYFSKKGWFK